MEKKRFLEGDNKRFCVVSRLLCFFCLFIGIYACQVDEDGVVNKGTLAFRMNVDTALVGVSTKASDLADFKDVNSYAVTIAQDSGVVAEYSRFDKMPAELELGAGARFRCQKEQKRQPLSMHLTFPGKRNLRLSRI
jgi:hypothetical protein